MSGGHFDYDQHRIGQIAESIQSTIDREEIGDPSEGYLYGFDEKTLGEFRNAVFFLKIAEVYAQRIDWLLSGDDGVGTFHKRLAANLEKEGLTKCQSTKK
ncbi:MAG: hypothetical protein ACYSWO_30035 [Planctomycetota bacterium]|jgi:hypothetical protein